MIQDFNGQYRHVNYLWDDTVAAKLDLVDLLVYRSNLLGSDQRITNTGGGNTSSKITEKDPLTGQETEVLWVKGSGGDLRTSKRGNFSSLYMDKLEGLKNIYGAEANRGVKTPIEDAMVDLYRHCTFNLNPRASSIDTPLHAFIPAKHVDHMHPNSVIALAAAANSEALTKEIFGDSVVWTPWMRPGFELGLTLERVARENPQAKGIIMGQHGLINWANDPKECYTLTLNIIEQAARFIEEKAKTKVSFGGAKVQSLPAEQRDDLLVSVLPWLRGQTAFQGKPMIATVQYDENVMDYANSADAPRLSELGTSCPDHFLRTKIKPLYVDFDPAKDDAAALQDKLAKGLEAYRADYAKYYETCRHANSPAMRNPNPTVIIIPGVGMIGWGKNKSESRVTAEFYNCAIHVMRGAEAMDKYIALPQQEAFDIEYWLLEEAKLQRMPAEQEYARKVAVIIGAGGGIGKETAIRLAKETAHVVCVDLKAELAQETAKEIEASVGMGIGVAGSDISNCGPVIGLACDITKRDTVQTMLKQTILAYGGVDSVAVTAGIFPSPDKQGMVPDAMWDVTFRINVAGAYFVANEAAKVWKQQSLSGGAFVLTTSANAVVSKKGSLAYDTSKAAANHLVRGLAVELAGLARVNGVAPATVVAGSSMFPRDRVISSLVKYDIPHSEDEDTESLRDKLAMFYAQRTLTKSPITPADQAKAIIALLGELLPKTTGQVIAVDGGLTEAFLR
ncbi:MAG: bifunctional rhamnulose-1-phosphate aldolase/short-chain dehydrogenase [Verrucomicrobiota bacterium JB022]|nr:bifunctional rhamnulose-1-phosphate aldolase/short-chain dehydrogenase [Verrucomicrobiota bacterium JB022]